MSTPRELTREEARAWVFYKLAVEKRCRAKQWEDLSDESKVYWIEKANPPEHKTRSTAEYIAQRLAGAPSREKPTPRTKDWPGTTFDVLDGLTAEQRKRFPIFEGFLKYFPNAAALVSNQSYRGQQQHAPGEPLQWKREKSSDHPDCMVRHLLEGKNAKIATAWRAMAELEEAWSRGEIDLAEILNQ